MQIVSNGDNLHEMTDPISEKNKKTKIICHLPKILPRVLSVNTINTLYILFLAMFFF